MKASSEKGGALIYILIAVALLAALTTTFIQPGGQSARTQNAFKLATQLNSQSRVIRSGIQDCILRYPQGDSDISDDDYYSPYPLNPTSTAFTTSDMTDQVSLLRCPGTSAAAGVDDHILIFGGSGEFSNYLSPAPKPLGEWTYFNDGKDTPVAVDGNNMDGVYYETRAAVVDPSIGEAMTKIDGLMSACEVDHIVGNADGTNGCAEDTQCLRFWIIRGSGTTATDGCP